MNRRHIPQARRDAAVADYRTSGDSYTVVAARHGVAKTSLQSWVNPQLRKKKPAKDDRALVGGRWVICPRRRVQVWEAW